MMRAFLLAAVALAACSMMQPSPPTTTTAGGGQAHDLCHASQHQNLIGMDESAIDQSTLPPRHRIICMGCMATMDYWPDRLTIHIGPGHKVASIGCG